MLLIVLAVAVSLFEAGAAIMIFTLFRIVTDPTVSPALPLVGELRDIFPGSSEEHLFRVMVLLIGAFFVVRAALYMIQSYLQNRITQNAGVRLSQRLFRAYLETPYSIHIRRNSAELIKTALDSTNEIVGGVLQPIIVLVSELLILIALLTIMLIKAPVATTAAFIVLGIVGVTIVRGLRPTLDTLGRTNRQMYGQAVRSLQEMLLGIREIKLLGKGGFFSNVFADKRSSLARTTYLRNTLIDLPRAVMETSLILLILIFLGFSFVGDADDRGEALTVVGFIAYGAMRALPPINRIVAAFNSLEFGGAALEEVTADLDLVPEDRTPVRGAELPLLPFRHGIELRNASFAYAEGRPIIKRVNLQIAKGQTIGIIGPTGGGKSTLLDLMLGLLEPSTGSVTVDGIDIRQRLSWWHRQLGMVPQRMFLIDDTLRRNVALGEPDEDIDQEMVESAVRIAQLSDFVTELDDGLDTEVGEQGVRLSGGQRQRIAIARALYRNPEVLIFDEATSALDVETEGALLQSLSKERPDQTLIMVAHRHGSLRSADRVLVVDKGMVVQAGSYAEVLATLEQLDNSAD